MGMKEKEWDNGNEGMREQRMGEWEWRNEGIENGNEGMRIENGRMGTKE